MKFTKYLFIAAASIFFIAACQKELDFTTDGLAHGSLKSAISGDCMPAAVNGIYKVDSTLNNANFIDVQVSIAETGTYEIKSDTVNGYSFKGTGSVGTTGVNTVRLYATGKPLLSGIDVFTINFDTSVCNVNVSVIGAGTGVAVFTLSGSPGVCDNAIINGIYTEGTALGASNTLVLTIDVADTGVYNIAAVSSNGMLFTATGHFGVTGIQPVTLVGAGTPQSAGPTDVTVSNLATTCSITINVGGSGTSPAVFTLDNVPGGCAGFSYTGTLTQGVAADASNNIQVNVTVTVIGTYNITSNTVNGVTYSGSGSFTITGPGQPVLLTASGTPTANGTFGFNLIGPTLTSSCTFNVPVAASTPQEEYLLLTPGSNFSQRLVGGAPSDTLYVRVGSLININASFYRIYEGIENGAVVDSSYYGNENFGKYYNIINTQSLGFDNVNKVRYLLLDSTLAIGGSWVSDLGTNSISGIPVTIKATSDIIDKGASVDIAGNHYDNVIKVHYLFTYTSGTTNTDFQENEIWFAKGKGLIYFKVNDVPVTTTAEEETTRIQVF